MSRSSLCREKSRYIGTVSSAAVAAGGILVFMLCTHRYYVYRVIFKSIVCTAVGVACVGKPLSLVTSCLG